MLETPSPNAVTFTRSSPQTLVKKGGSLVGFQISGRFLIFIQKLGKKYKREFYIDMKFGTGTQLRNKTYMALSKKGK